MSENISISFLEWKNLQICHLFDVFHHNNLLPNYRGKIIIIILYLLIKNMFSGKNTHSQSQNNESPNFQHAKAEVRLITGANNEIDVVQRCVQEQLVLSNLQCWSSSRSLLAYIRSVDRTITAISTATVVLRIISREQNEGDRHYIVLIRMEHTRWAKCALKRFTNRTWDWTSCSFWARPLASLLYTIYGNISQMIKKMNQAKLGSPALSQSRSIIHCRIQWNLTRHLLLSQYQVELSLKKIVQQYSVSFSFQRTV